jgi:hypothetical protein
MGYQAIKGAFFINDIKLLSRAIRRLKPPTNIVLSNL